MTGTVARLGAADVRAAADRIAEHVHRTPLLSVRSLPGLLLKAEHRQRGGSFKVRGAANAMLSVAAGEVVAGSSGNHGIALATLARPLGVGVTVVLAAGASPAKLALIRALGARALVVPGGVVERDRWAAEHAERTGAALVPSSDHEAVVAGQGTVGLEILADAPDVETVFVPTGGGGLLAGVCLAAWHHSVRVVGVEPTAARRYARSVAAGRPVQLPPPDTIADGLRGQQPGAVPYPIVRDRVDELVGVTDAEIRTAVDLLERAGIRAEPSGAVALAGALRAGRAGTVAAIISGGNTSAAVAAADPCRTPHLEEIR